MNEKVLTAAADAVAKAAPVTWVDGLLIAGSLLFIMLVARFFTPDHLLLPLPDDAPREQADKHARRMRKIEGLLFGVPIVLGAVIGYRAWTTGTFGPWSGAMWGGALGGGAHVVLAVLGLGIKLWHEHSYSAAAALLAKKFGVEVKNPAAASAGAA